MTKKISENDEDVIIATEAKKKYRKPVVKEEDESDDDESEDDETETDEDETEADESDEEKPSIKESTDHIIGIVSSKKFHLLEDGIMGVVRSKIRERIEEEKEQIKASLVFKGV